MILIHLQNLKQIGGYWEKHLIVLLTIYGRGLRLFPQASSFLMIAMAPPLSKYRFFDNKLGIAMLSSSVQ